jgi:hypothetical protein
MTVELIGFITLALGLLSLFRPESFIVRLFLSSTLLGSSAAFILEAVGGTNISPAHLLLGFLAYRLLSVESIYGAAAKSVTLGTPGFWLLLTVVYSVLSAYFMPRLFTGQTAIFAVRNLLGGYSTPLEPAMSNLTQSVYFVGDLACFVLLYGYASTLSGRRVLGDAAVWCAALNLGFAILDLATYFTNTTELMSVIRNANYALLNDQEVAGFKRIVGSFTEASSFGSTTLGYFAFTSRLWLLGVRRRMSLILTLLSLSALLFSTSTTAYVGLAAFLLYSYVNILIGAFGKPLTLQIGIFLFVVPAALVGLVIVIALNDAYWASLQNLLDTLVLNKMSTDSGIERSSWNRQAMQNLFDTFGFGVGNGSVRASSFPVGVLASLGIFGTLIFGMFFVKVLFSRTGHEPFDRLDDAYRQAAKSVCVAWLITATTSGALIDLGLPYFAFAALACAKPVVAGPTLQSGRPDGNAPRRK